MHASNNQGVDAQADSGLPLALEVFAADGDVNLAGSPGSKGRRAHVEFCADHNGWTCDVCGCDLLMSGKQANSDHSHNTGMPRGVLCTFCNTTEGKTKGLPDKDAIKCFGRLKPSLRTRRLAAIKKYRQFYDQRDLDVQHVAGFLQATRYAQTLDVDQTELAFNLLAQWLCRIEKRTPGIVAKLNTALEERDADLKTLKTGARSNNLMEPNPLATGSNGAWSGNKE